MGYHSYGILWYNNCIICTMDYITWWGARCFGSPCSLVFSVVCDQSKTYHMHSLCHNYHCKEWKIKNTLWGEIVCLSVQTMKINDNKLAHWRYWSHACQRPGISWWFQWFQIVDLNQSKEVNGEKWLECKQVKQKGGSWISCEADQWMPFRYSQYYLQEAWDTSDPQWNVVRIQSRGLELVQLWYLDVGRMSHVQTLLSFRSVRPERPFRPFRPFRDSRPDSMLAACLGQQTTLARRKRRIHALPCQSLTCRTCHPYLAGC